MCDVSILDSTKKQIFHLSISIGTRITTTGFLVKSNNFSTKKIYIWLVQKKFKIPSDSYHLLELLSHLCI